jgi:hypothetical protein
MADQIDLERGGPGAGPGLTLRRGVTYDRKTAMVSAEPPMIG